MIAETIASIRPQRVHMFSQGWWTSVTPWPHINIGYVSDDPVIVRRQIESCQAIVSPAKLAIVPDWYGPDKKPDCENYLQALRWQSETTGTEFSVMIDQGATVGKSLQELIDYLRTQYFTSPAYSRYNGKFIVWIFGFKVDVAAVQAANTDLLLFTQDSGPQAFAWPNGFAPDSPQAYLKRVLPQVLVPCLWKQFDDHKRNDPTTGVWGGSPRLLLGPAEWSLWKSLASITSKTSELGLATLNDYEERTCLEPDILKEYAAMLNGQADTLEEVNG